MAQSLPIFANGDGALIQYFYKDNLTNDYMSAVYYGYTPGLNPNPAGNNIETVVIQANQIWQTFWAPFLAVPCIMYRTVGHHFRSFIARPPNRFKLNSIGRFETLVSVPGTKTGDMLPAFACYNIAKHTGRPGRGSSGHLRLPGIPVSEHADGTLVGSWVTLINNAIADPNAFNITDPSAFSDLLRMHVPNGRRINTLPPASTVPIDNMDVVIKLTLANNVTSQVTRKFGRRRT